MTAKRDELWAQYEELAYKIVSDLNPHADVHLDERIVGSQSQTERQIDVTARWREGGESFLLIVQVRHRSRRADINTIGEFKSVIEDLGADRGVLICSSGFSKAAITYARNVGISLYSAHEASSKVWPMELMIPLVWVDLSPLVAFSGRVDADQLQFRPVLAPDGSQVLSCDGGVTETTMPELFSEPWNRGDFDRTPGIGHIVTPDIRLTTKVASVDGAVAWAPVRELQFDYFVESKSWLKYYRPMDCRGLRNFLDDRGIEPTYIAYDDLPAQRDDSWTRISDPNKLAAHTAGIILTTESFHLRNDQAESVTHVRHPNPLQT